MSAQPQPPISDTYPHVPVEEQTRLATYLHAKTGIGLLPKREQQIVLRSVAIGLRQRAPHCNESTAWAVAFEQMAASDTDLSALAACDKQDVYPHPILQVIIAQPSPSRTTEQRKRSLAIAGHAFMAVVFSLHRTPSRFSDRLRQLFRSEKEGWLEFCAQDFLSVEQLQTWTPVTTVAAVHEFRSDLLELHRTSIPSASSYLDLKVLSPTPAADHSELRAEEPSSAPKEKRPDDVTERLDLFELQKQRDCQQDVVDGYRLPVHWGRLHPDELHPLLQILKGDLLNFSTEEISRKRRAHAAARMVSFFAGISLKKCLRLPLHRRGSMKLDIKHGVIRRDALAIAPRADRADRKRFHGRWWRTRLPKEVTRALQDIWHECPQARTLGELIHAVGLDYEACQSLLNDAWPSSHRPEDTRFAMSLRPALLALEVHPALVSRITGDTMVTPASDHYYFSISESQVHSAMVMFCHWAGLTPPDAPVRDRQIGTPKVLTLVAFREAMTKLNQMVMRARNQLTPKSSIPQILAFHNLYTCAVALQIIWGIGGRGDRIPALTFERLFSSESYFAISDRRVDRYSRQRIIPSTQVLTHTRCHYLEHLRSLIDSLERACESSTGFVTKVVAGARPHECAFFIYVETSEGWLPRTLLRQDLSDLAKRLGVDELNAARHFWFNALLERDVAQVAIEAILGHHLNGAEAFGFSSGVSVREASDYVRPIVAELQEALGFRPLIGRGRLASRFLCLPDLHAPRTLRALPSILLQRKLAAADLLIKDVGIYEQDPPSTSKTLLAHAHLNRLSRRYIECDVVRAHPIGALLFCLISRELVLTPSEQEALLNAALSDGVWSTGRLVVIEASHDGRPVAQRLPTDRTLASIPLARHAHEQSPITITDAQRSMHRLLLTLDRNWPGRDPADSTRLLAMLASHWAAVEIPAGSLFVALHKAPFIPAEDIARIYYQRSCSLSTSEASPGRARPWRNSTGDDPTHQILKRWANKDTPIGEEGARRKGCLAELKARRDDAELDQAEALRIDLLCADLQPDAPYRTLSPTVIPSYDGGYRVFFDFARREGAFEFDPEIFLEIYAAMGGNRDFTQSCSARWQMLHICAFLKSRGYRVPPGFLETQSRKEATWPRLPVYTTQAEIAAARGLIDKKFEGRGGTFSFAGLRLALQRAAPMRVSEPRYSSPKDFDPNSRLFHITTNGHIHLKSQRSRGSVLLSEPLAEEMKQLLERRRAISVGTHTLLFADVQLKATYAAFDLVSAAMRDDVIHVTGQTHFRQHDLRSAAATDCTFDVVQEINRLAEGTGITSTTNTETSISEKHRRFAWAGRQARHASALTTMRYYNSAGVLDLRHHLDLASVGTTVTGKYLSAVFGKLPQALYAAAHRSRKRSKDNVGTEATHFQTILDDFLRDVANQFPTPLLGPTIASLSANLPATSKGSNSSILTAAVLRCAMGEDVPAASDSAQLPQDLVEKAHANLTQHCNALGIRSHRVERTPLTVCRLRGEELPIDDVIQCYANWLCANKPTLVRAALSIAAVVDRSGSRLTIHCESQLLDLLPVLKVIQQAGFIVALRLGRDRLLHQLPHAEIALSNSGVLIHPDNSTESSLATVRFLFAFSASTAKDRTGVVSKRGRGDATAILKASPRHYGRAGHLAVAGLLYGLLL